MIGSFHESMISSRHYSFSGSDGNARNSIDENSSYDDLFKVRYFLSYLSEILPCFSFVGNSNLAQRKRTGQTNNQIITRANGLLSNKNFFFLLSFSLSFSINTPVKTMINHHHHHHSDLQCFLLFICKLSLVSHFIFQ